MEVEKIFSTYWLLSRNNGSASGEKCLYTQWRKFLQEACGSARCGTCISRLSLPVDEQLESLVPFSLLLILHIARAYMCQREILNAGLSKQTSNSLLQVT